MAEKKLIAVRHADGRIEIDPAYQDENTVSLEALKFLDLWKRGLVPAPPSEAVSARIRAIVADDPGVAIAWHTVETDAFCTLIIDITGHLTLANRRLRTDGTQASHDAVTRLVKALAYLEGQCQRYRVNLETQLERPR